jgi:ankyrin repeat protein
LLNVGVNIDIRDKRRQETTLQMAARLGRVDCIKYLLKKGVNIGATNRFSENALQLTEASGHVEVARVLMEYGMRH